MKIISEKTGKEYATVEKCLAAEKDYDDAIAAKRVAEEKRLAEVKAKRESELAERKQDAKLVDEARQKMIEANKNYHKVLEEFCKKHGAYHFSIRPNGEDFLNYLFDEFLSF